MDFKTLDKYISSLKGAKLSYPYEKDLAVYTIGSEMFALVESKKTPLRISLRCDRQLMKVLLERYEEVMPGHKLNKSKWITLVVTGQLNQQEIEGLIQHSYTLAVSS